MTKQDILDKAIDFLYVPLRYSSINHTNYDLPLSHYIGHLGLTQEELGWCREIEDIRRLSFIGSYSFQAYRENLLTLLKNYAQQNNLDLNLQSINDRFENHQLCPYCSTHTKPNLLTVHSVYCCQCLNCNKRYHFSDYKQPGEKHG